MSALRNTLKGIKDIPRLIKVIIQCPPTALQLTDVAGRSALLISLIIVGNLNAHVADEARLVTKLNKI